jgi:hypothetical protein
MDGLNAVSLGLKILGALGVLVAVLTVWNVDATEGYNYLRWGFGGTLTYMVGGILPSLRR